MKNFLKWKIKNKFILWVVWIIALIIWVQWYLSFSLKWVDTNTYAVLVNWNAQINQQAMLVEEKAQLKIGDFVKTIWDDSLVVLEWWDGSITRLWWDSEIQINELSVEKDLSKINLSFDLKSGKSWSNVVSFLWEESYFKQNFEDVEASVRGTVFDVDLEKDYIYVEDHEVRVQKGWESSVIKENSALSISRFSLIEIQEFLNTLRDKAWQDINKKLDIEYLEALKSQLLENFSKQNINSLLVETLWEKVQDLESIEQKVSLLSADKKDEAYKKLLEQYQKLNFIKSDDNELFTQKNDLKKVLISLSDWEDKKSLIKYSLYDLQDAITWENLEGVKESFWIIWENMDIVKSLNIDLGSDILWDLWLVPESMKDFFWENTQILKEVLWDRFWELNLPKINIDWIKSDVENIKDTAIDSANKFRDNLLNNF